MLLAFALILLLAVGWWVRHALLLIYIAAVFAVVLKPFVDRVSRRGILGWRPSRGVALLLMISVVALGLTLLLAFAIPPLVDDLQAFADRAPELLEQLRSRARSIPYLQDIDVKDLPSRLASAGGSFAAGFGSVVTSFVTVILLVVYFILDGANLLRALLSTVPAGSRDRLDRTLQRAGKRMRGWLTGQFILMLILGGAALTTFGLMRIPYFYLLGVFAGIANIIPLLGPIATVILAAAIAATQSLWKVAGVLIFYAVYQQIEEAILTPRIMKAQVELSAAVVLIALLIGSELAGIGGALVAVPTAVLVTEIAGEYLVQRDASTTHRDSAT